MIGEKLKIFYRKIDENGNIISEVFEDEKKYVMYHYAVERAEKLYSKELGYIYVVATSNPWAVDTMTFTCDCCGKDYNADVNYIGRVATNSVTLYSIANGKSKHDFPCFLGSATKYNRVCNDCAYKITTFIETLKADDSGNGGLKTKIKNFVSFKKSKQNTEDRT